ncbi:MAG: DUF4139 domain-containing protein [Pseudomonadota bacterium]
MNKFHVVKHDGRTRRQYWAATALAAVTIAGGTTAIPSIAMVQRENEASDLSLTIYNDNLALIHDVRTLSYARGRSVVSLPGVSSQIQAPTVTFSAPGVSIIEQNFDYDLLTPAKLMEKAVGRQVKIVRTNPATGRETTQTATVLSVNRGVVLKIGDRIEVLRDDNLPTRVIFDRVPENLRADPTLSVTVETDRPQRTPTSLTYLTSGLGWRADYVAAFDEAAGAMDFQGWVTLSNTTETSFKNAQVQMVAGDVAQSNTRGSGRRYPARGRASSTRSGGIEATGEARLGDNYLYPLPGRTTVASQQTKQVGFVSADGAKAAKTYEYWAYGFNTINEPQNVDVRIAFSNSKAAGLGAALPKGIVRVYTKDAQGRSQFIGEDNIQHTAGGADLAIKIGEAFDVTVQPAVRANKIVNKRVTETTMAYTLRNAKAKPVTVTIRQQAGWSGLETQILSETVESRNPAANQYVWSVPVPAEGESVLSFTIRQKSR